MLWALKLDMLSNDVFYAEKINTYLNDDKLDVIFLRQLTFFPTKLQKNEKILVNL